MNYIKCFLSSKTSILLGYAIFIAIGLFHHEIWRDEAWAFLIARDAPSLLAIIPKLRTETHPPLWYLVLFVTTHLGGGVAAMQVVHGIIAVGMAAALLRFDIPKYILILFLFGYYFIFEYTIISRNYSLSVLFFFLSAYELDKDRIGWQLGLWLGLAALSTVPAMVLVMCLLPWILFSHRRHDKISNLLVPAVICLTFSFFSYSNPILLSYLAGAFSTPVDLKTIGSFIGNAFLPLPQIKWPLGWQPIDTMNFHFAQWLCFFTCVILVFRFAGKTAVCIFLTGCAILLAMLSQLFPGTMRHQGYLWVWFLFSLLATRDSFKKILQNRVGKPVFIFILLLQIPLGLAMWGSDFLYPFSNSKNVAEWLKNSNIKEVNEVRFGGSPDYALNSIGAYLAEKKYFNLSVNQIRTFAPYYREPITFECSPPPDDPLGCLKEIDFRGIWIYNESLAELEPRITEITHFSNAMVSDENFWIYEQIK